MKRKLVALVCCVTMVSALFAGCGKTSSNKYAGDDYAGEVELADYTGIQVSASVATVDDEDVQAEIDAILLNYASEKKYTADTETTVQDGDIVNMDYTGYLEEGAFDAGIASSVSLTMGAGTYDDIDGFEDGLMGATVGETITISVTFADDYDMETAVEGMDETVELSGRDATFEVTINYVIRSVPAEFTDEFVQTYYSEYDLSTTEDLEEYVRTLISDNRILDEIWEDFLDECTVITYDSDEVDSYVEQMVDYYTSYMEDLGYDLEDYIAYYYDGMTLDEFSAQYLTPEAKEYVKESMVVYQIADNEGIEVTDEIYARDAESYAASEDFDTVEDMEEYYGEAAVYYSILYNLVTRWVAEQCEIVDD